MSTSRKKKHLASNSRNVNADAQGRQHLSVLFEEQNLSSHKTTQAAFHFLFVQSVVMALRRRAPLAIRTLPISDTTRMLDDISQDGLRAVTVQTKGLQGLSHVKFVATHYGTH